MSGWNYQKPAGGSATTYTFSAYVWAKKKGAASILNYLSGTTSSAKNTTVDEWESLSYTFQSSPEGTAQIRCRINTGEPTIAYFDGVNLVKTEDPLDILTTGILAEYGENAVTDYLGNQKSLVTKVSIPTTAAGGSKVKKRKLRFRCGRVQLGVYLAESRIA